MIDENINFTAVQSACCGDAAAGRLYGRFLSDLYKPVLKTIICKLKIDKIITKMLQNI